MIQWKPSHRDCDKILQYKLAMVVSHDYERILIGTSKNILLRLEGNEDVDLFYDESRPFGTYLLCQETDNKWNEAVFNLEKAQTIINKPALARPLYESVVELERNVQYFLEEKCDSLDPVSIFVAMRIWYSHWSIRGLKDKKKTEAFINFSRNLVRPFSHSSHKCMSKIQITPQNPIFKNCQIMNSNDSFSVIYTSISNPSLECILVDNSIIQLERYYKMQVERYEKYLNECKICKRLFVSDNLRFDICSDACREQAAQESKLQRQNDPIAAEIESVLANTRSHWTRRLAKIKKSPEGSTDQIEKYKNAMRTFQKEATSLRKEHKQGNLSTKDFTDWLIKQQEEAESVLQELMVTKR